MFKSAFYRIGSELFPQGSMFSPNPEDVMLVSYPKSGNTWLRALVAHLVGVRHSLGEMDHLVPDVYASKGRVLRNAHRFPCSGRLIKSHESFRAAYKRVILLVRDPRDVCVSYYHYLGNILRTFDPDETSLDDFVDIFIAGQFDDYGNWGEHTKSWLAAENADLLLMRYEDLLEDAPQCLARICKFLGLDEESPAILKAVEDCSLERLRGKEEQERSQWHPMKKATGSASFFRQGSSSGGSDLAPASNERICNVWRDPMQTLGYLD